MRNFELIPISLDSPDTKGQVLAFLNDRRAIPGRKIKKSLKAEGRTSSNYIFTGTRVDDLAEELDPEWPGPIPFSMLVDPEGNVLYRKTGKIDPVEVKTKVLEVMKTYYH